MTLSANQTELIKQLENTNQLEGRYEKLKCINAWDGGRRGELSLVFQAYDVLCQSVVAIKVMDPDHLSNAYRIKAFEREPSILDRLEGKNRCLQILDGLQRYNWKIKVPASPEPLSIPCGFFVTEWPEEDVDDYFLRQQDFDAIEKLLVFRQLLLATEAIHRWDVCHRDIKWDNIRVRSTDGEPTLILIDFGTAARLSDESLNSNYVGPVGAKAFSPPETFMGLSGNRWLGKLSDSYALGSLLFNMFNSRLFYTVQKENTDYEKLMMTLTPIIVGENSDKGKLELWRKHIVRLRSLKSSPKIDGPGSTLPVSISQNVEQTYLQLTNFDFLSRLSDLSIARNRIDTAIRILSSQKWEALEVKRRRIRRAQKQERVHRKQQRLERYTTNWLPQNV